MYLFLPGDTRPQSLVLFLYCLLFVWESSLVSCLLESRVGVFFLNHRLSITSVAKTSAQLRRVIRLLFHRETS